MVSCSDWLASPQHTHSTQRIVYNFLATLPQNLKYHFEKYKSGGQRERRRVIKCNYTFVGAIFGLPSFRILPSRSRNHTLHNTKPIQTDTETGQ